MENFSNGLFGTRVSKVNNWFLRVMIGKKSALIACFIALGKETGKVRSEVNNISERFKLCGVFLGGNVSGERRFRVLAINKLTNHYKSNEWYYSGSCSTF